ncbi:cation:proton antiporter [Phaeacidiphilus oryzae]|uniref:cation:proton antiporter n=1 Tax=Phaeacidiphilus oryzae TaxID=348818 RepID=UPI000569C214|nr:monovalent cation/H(+) antiporter subunit G [Phaeacidiphilus oryzae]
MTGGHIAVLVLMTAGCGVLLLSAFALLRLPAPFDRLHALTPAASLGAPLVALAAAFDTGPGRGAVKLVVIGVLLAAGGPVTGSAIARVAAQRAGVETEDSPE